MILRIRRSLVAFAVLVLGLTGVLLAVLSGTAGSAPKQDTTVIAPANGVDSTTPQPDNMGYDASPGAMGYDSVRPYDAGGR
jgi:ABC-type oligopeptide transport system substrate-binding subunit